MENKQSSPQQVIIAMKGHPGTGKSTLARAIAAALRIPLLDKDDIRDNLVLPIPHSSSSLLNDLSYSIFFAIASTNLSLGQSLLLDSPLSRLPLLRRLLRVAPRGARLVVVECRPGDEAEWRRRLEERGKGDEGGHKPRTWEELERLVEGYEGCWEYDVEGEGVERMLVDTTREETLEEIVDRVVRFVTAH